MNYLLIYSYSKNQYELIRTAKQLSQLIGMEILYVFEEAELSIARKIFRNLTLERQLNSISAAGIRAMSLS